MIASRLLMRVALLVSCVACVASSSPPPRMRALGIERSVRMSAERADASRRLAATTATDPSMANETDMRTDLCAKSRAIVNGSLSVADALSGQSLHFVAALYDDNWIACDGDGTCTGFHVDLMDALAQRAGFTYQITGVNWEAIGSWTEYLVSSMYLFDGNLDWWLETPSRVARSVKCPYRFLDMGIMSATFASEETTSTMDDLERLFVGPFQPMVWLYLILITFFTSGLYFALENGINQTDCPPEMQLLDKLSRVLYLGANEFVQGEEGFSPRTGFGRMVVLSFAFFVLLNVQSYGSMLTTTLINDAAMSVGFDSFDDAVMQEAAICVYAGTAMEDYVLSNYPAANVISTPGDPYVAHANGECEVVVSTKQPEYSFAQVGGPTTNLGCKLAPIGGTDYILQNYGGGWMTHLDYSEKCTSVIADAMSYWLLDMDLDGTIARIYKDLTKAKTIKECSVVDTGSEKLKGLSPYQMSGVWLLHAVICLAVMLGAAIKRFMPKTEAHVEKLKELKEDDRPPTRADLSRMKAELLRHLNTLEANEERLLGREAFAKATSGLSQSGELIHELTPQQCLEELRKMDPSITEEQASEWMLQVDKDGDGNIQIDEFLVLMERLGQKMGKPLPSDVSGDMEMLRRRSEEMKATTEALAAAEAAEIGPAPPAEANKQKDPGITLEAMMCM